MDITPKFYLRNSKAKSLTSIQLVVNFNKNKLKYGTGLRISPDLWDGEIFRPTRKRQVLSKKKESVKSNLRAINTELEKISTLVTRRFSYYREHEIVPTEDDIRAYLNQKLEKDIPTNQTEEEAKKSITLNKYIDKFIKAIINGDRLTDKGKPYGEGTIKNYFGFKSQIDAYQKKRRRRLNFEHIDMDFYADFVKFFNEKNYRPNTIGRHVKHLKTIMRASKEDGLHINLNFENRKFITIKEDVMDIYLSDDELNKISALDLSDNKDFEIVRDVFLAGCYTAQRYSDYSRINKEHISKTGKGTPIIKLIQVKTGIGVQIPISSQLDPILKKYNYSLPETQEHYVNKRIKEIAKMAFIDNIEVVESTQGGKKVIENVPKYELVTTHTARRSGATNMYLAKVPVIAIMAIGGWTTERNFLKYIKVTKEEHADILASHSYFS